MSPEANTAEQLQSQVDDLASHVDRRVQAEYLDEHDGLMDTIMHGGRPRAQLLSTLRDKATQAVDEALSQVNSLDHVLSGRGASELEAQVQSAMPSLLEFGGAWRLLAVMPKSYQDPAAAARRVTDSLGNEASSVVGSDNSFSLCVEAQELSLAHVAVSLVHRRRDYVEFAERVRSRSDISWTKITDALPASSSQPGVPAGAAPAASAGGAPPVTTTQLIT